VAVTLTAAPNAAGPAATAWISAHRWPLLAALLLIGGALALGVATYRPDWLPGRVTSAADRAVNNLSQRAGEAARTVAGLFELRSPGERASGALASLKQKRQPLLHERALPKIRRTLSPLAAIVAAPPVPPIAPVPIAPVPLYNAVGGPKPGGPVALTVPPGGVPVVFPGLTLLTGGGGGVVVPPPSTITPPDTPVPVVPGTPTPQGVPEPGSWALMLIGFAFIGGALRRNSTSDAAES